MSSKVVSEIRTFSQAEHAARLVLWTIGENANDEGVAYPPIEDRCPSCRYAHLDQRGVCKDCGHEVSERKRKSIACGARISEREVRDSIAELRQLGELQVVKARRGRSLFNVYWVTVGRLRDFEPTYTDLPFELLERFPRLPADPAGTQEPGLPGLVPAESRDLYRQNRVTCTGRIAGPTRARVSGGVAAEPSREPSREPTSSNEDVPAAAGEEAPEEQLRWALTAELGARPATRSEHGAWGKAIAELAEIGANGDELRARCAVYRERWPSAALTPMALVRWWGFLGAAAEATSSRHEGWLEQTSWQFESEDAHWIVDQWTNVDDDQRQAFHLRVDAIRRERAGAAA